MRCTSTKSGHASLKDQEPVGILAVVRWYSRRMKNTEKRVIALGLAAFAGLAVRARSRLELDRKPAPQEVSNNFMKSHQLGITYIGGPTCLLEFGGVRLLTDPTFGPAGGEYKSASSTLRKLVGPALDPEAIGFIDYVLLSHDHHFDRPMKLSRTSRICTSSLMANS
jgi:hypothetical protein